MTSEPSRSDADLLLRLLELFLSEPVRAARNFWHELPEGSKMAEIEERYGSRYHEHIGSSVAFWQTVGGLLKSGFLREDLAFSTFLDDPPWKKIKAAALLLRQVHEDPHVMENFEYAYDRALAWRARGGDQQAAGPPPYR